MGLFGGSKREQSARDNVQSRFEAALRGEPKTRDSARTVIANAQKGGKYDKSNRERRR